MFGFSITKLLFTIAAVIVVWNGFKWYNRMQENRGASAGGKPARGNQGSAAKSAASPDAAGASDAEEMIKCVACETYLSSANAVSCGKDGCPYPG